MLEVRRPVISLPAPVRVPDNVEADATPAPKREAKLFVAPATVSPEAAPALLLTGPVPYVALDRHCAGVL